MACQWKYSNPMAVFCYRNWWKLLESSCPGYVSACCTTLQPYPALRAGVHRQILYTTIGIFLGYHLTKFENYKNAKKDRELCDYMRRHPELFVQDEPRKIGVITEPFHPVR
ncbi:NADH dehydrogenase [ubiquinone] 1 subunit C2-like [Mantella aurantiaca]